MGRSANEDRGYESPVMDTGRDRAELRARLAPWLADRMGVPGLSVGAVEAPATSGVANETLLVEAYWERGGLQRRQGLAVRIASTRPLFTGRSFRKQYLVQQALAAEPGVPVPELVGYEEDPAVLGSPFFVAERVDGLVPGDRPHYTESGFVAEASGEQRRRLWESAVDALARLHAVPAARLAFLDAASGRSGLDEELHYWRDYTDRLEVGPGWNRDMLERGWEWLIAHRPRDAASELSWGDARIGNMVFRDFEVVALLDWDTISLAGPVADLAWWIQMDRHSWELLPGLGRPDELVDRWEYQTGRQVVHLRWYLVFTAFRLGVIRMKLRRMMVADGLLSAAEARPDARNESIQLLALWLDETPPGLPVPRKPVVTLR
ncbi:MAG: phosphotransferase family protein [Acidimicrobiaceae bacterium]|nr:phosphotransferase family protein [Acidimicrobiaceae bacterium]